MRGEKFWRTLHEVGLTPVLLAPSEYPRLLEFGLGLTDVAKARAGRNRDIARTDLDPDGLRRKIEHYAPRYLCLNGKKAACAFLGRRAIDYGPQRERLGRTRLFVAPSTSGAASGYWDIESWRELAQLCRIPSTEICDGLPGSHPPHRGGHSASWSEGLGGGGRV